MFFARIVKNHISEHENSDLKSKIVIHTIAENLNQGISLHSAHSDCSFIITLLCLSVSYKISYFFRARQIESDFFGIVRDPIHGSCTHVKFHLFGRVWICIFFPFFHLPLVVAFNVIFISLDVCMIHIV